MSETASWKTRFLKCAKKSVFICHYICCYITECRRHAKLDKGERLMNTQEAEINSKWNVYDQSAWAYRDACLRYVMRLFCIPGTEYLICTLWADMEHRTENSCLEAPAQAWDFCRLWMVVGFIYTPVHVHKHTHFLLL